MRKNNRKNEQSFYQQTRENENAPLQKVQSPGPKSRMGPTSPFIGYKLPAILTGILVWIGVAVGLQSLGWAAASFSNQNAQFLADYRLFTIEFWLRLLVASVTMMVVFFKFRASWNTKNAMYNTEGIEDYTNDSYIQTVDHLTQSFEVAPDAGLGFKRHASTIMSHIMLSNKGIRKIDMPVRDMSVDGYVKRDENGDIVRKKVPMFNQEFANKLFDMSRVPQADRTIYDATDYDFNRKLTRKEGGDGKRRDVDFRRKGYDKLSDYINNEFFELDTETERPGRVYFYDSRPMNTVLIASTRRGKGQTFIEPACDLWTREMGDPWNLFVTDPKGGAPRWIVKSYSLI